MQSQGNPHRRRQGLFLARINGIFQHRSIPWLADLTCGLEVMLGLVMLPTPGLAQGGIHLG